MLKIGDCVITPIGNGIIIDKEKNIRSKKNPMLRFVIKLQSLHSMTGSEFNKIGDNVCYFSNQLEINNETNQTQLF